MAKRKTKKHLIYDRKPLTEKEYMKMLADYNNECLKKQKNKK